MLSLARLRAPIQPHTDSSLARQLAAGRPCGISASQKANKASECWELSGAAYKGNQSGLLLLITCPLTTIKPTLHI